MNTRSAFDIENDTVSTTTRVARIRNALSACYAKILGTGPRVNICETQTRYSKIDKNHGK